MDNSTRKQEETKRRSRRFKGAAWLGVLLLLAAGELGFRLVVRRANPELAARLQTLAENAGIVTSTRDYHSHPYLAYVRSDTILEKNGIRIGGQFYPRRRKADFRIACLGGSATMKQYPKALEAYLACLPRTARFEVMDFGCEGWTSTEVLVNYMTRVTHFKPDVVLIHTGEAESRPWTWPDFQTDYAHYRQAWRTDPVGPVRFFLLSRSWILSWLLQKAGADSADVETYVVKDVPPSLMQPPAPEGRRVYEENLRSLLGWVHSDGAKALLAPMAYDHRATGPEPALLEECNALARRVARESAVPVVETDALLQRIPDAFAEPAQAAEKGNYAKAQVFSQAVGVLLESREAEAARRMANPSFTAGRDIVLQWNYPSENIRDFHIQVQIGSDKEIRYVGRTNDPNAQSFRWKTGDPECSPVLADDFKSGPQYGLHYAFRVIPIDKTTGKAVTHLDTRKGVRVVEKGL